MNATKGFTLIELSIVLVIIGLIVGGVLVGQDLIKASEVRATISQIERYQTATNAFRGKYGALPGDLNAVTATTFGFTPRGNFPGEGDGNGFLEGVGFDGPNSNTGVAQATGETVMYWVDLTYANGMNVNLIDGSFNTASPTVVPSSTISTTMLPRYMPSAKLGRGTSIYAAGFTLTNYFVLSLVTSVSSGGFVSANPGVTVLQAYQIDKKIDDGLPMAGGVTAAYLNPGVVNPAHTSSPAIATDCYDSTASPAYAINVSNGSGVNCALAFRFQ